MTLQTQKKNRGGIHDKAVGSDSFFSGIAGRLEASGLVRTMEKISYFAIIFAVIGFGFDILDRRADREFVNAQLKSIQANSEYIKSQYNVWDDEQLARAWQLAIMTADGNSGKVWALQFLHQKGQNLSNIDLSPRTLNGRVHLFGINLGGVTMPNAILRRAFLVEAKFPGANLISANFRSADLQDANFSSANLKNTNFEGAELNRTNFEDANLQGANVSNALLSGAVISNEQLGDTWVWEDRLPRGLSEKLTSAITKCPKELRKDYRSGGNTGRPKKCKSS